MRACLVAVGTRMPNWVEEGFRDYARRLRGELRLELREVAAARRGRSGDPARWQAEEAQRLLAAAPKGGTTVALDQHGQCVDSAELARHLEVWMNRSGDLALLVGGADGFDPRVLEAADWVWSLSPLTLPHAMVRVLVAEQLYRAYSLLRNHPYHRG